MSKKTYAKKWNEFFVNSNCKTFVCKTAIVLHNFWKAFEEPGIFSKEPAKANNFFHVMKNKNDVPVLACVDANKDRFYARISQNEKILLTDDDWPLEELYKKTKKIKKLIVAGPDRNKLSDLIKAQNKKIELLVPSVNIITTEALFDIAEKNIAAKVPPLKDFDGPVYLRASEAEIKQNQQN